jgi:hypothetical protein
LRACNADSLAQLVKGEAGGRAEVTDSLAESDKIVHPFRITKEEEIFRLKFTQIEPWIAACF